MKNIYKVLVTDLFCGELNYSTVDRLEISAHTERGAIIQIGRLFGLRFRKQYGCAYSDVAIYHSTSRLTGVEIELKDLED